ncbi:MAG: glycosyltransferase, partial [Planctomycetaceae bacterium]|nr:glycosyltransferase [Planctomycetaceae bacterium]
MSVVVFTLALPDNTGAARMVCSYCEALLRRGHSVVVVHGQAPERSVLPTLRQLGVTTIFEPRLGFPVSPLLPRSLGGRLKKTKPACLIGVNQRDRAVALSVAQNLSVPGIICAQNQHRFWGGSLLAAFKKSYYGMMVRKYADMVICTSGPVQREFTEWFGVSPEKTCCLNNAIDVQAVRRFSSGDCENVRRELGVHADEFL